MRNVYQSSKKIKIEEEKDVIFVRHKETGDILQVSRKVLEFLRYIEEPKTLEEVQSFFNDHPYKSKEEAASVAIDLCERHLLLM